MRCRVGLLLVAAASCIFCCNASQAALQVANAPANLKNRKQKLPLPLPTPDTGNGAAVVPADTSRTVGWLGVLGGALCHLALGTIYCWGNFAPYAPPKLRYFAGEGLKGGQPDTIWVLPGTFVAQTLTMPVGPWLQKKVGCRNATLIGCWLMAAGVLLSSYAQNLVQFMLTYSLLFGAGIGLAYTAPMVNGWRWLPEKKGLVSGCVVAGFGSGGFIFNQIGSRLINPSGVGATEGTYPDAIYANFPVALRKLAVIYFVLTGLGSLLIRPPPPAAAGAPAAAPPSGLALKEALNTRTFWALWFMMLGIGTSGINVAGTYKTFGSLKHKDDRFQALVGSLGALSNGAGRLFWGNTLDAKGFKRPFAVLTTLQAVAMALYSKVSNSRVGFAAATCLILFCLGGNFSMFPAITTKLFGVKDGALIYGVLFSAFSVASVAGSQLTKTLIAKLGWNGVFTVMAALSVGVLAVLATFQEQRQYVA